MKPCLLCDTEEMYWGLLCKNCKDLVANNPDAKKRWEKLRGKKNKTLRRFRQQLLLKSPSSQTKAFRYIKKVANLYTIKLQPERIYGSYIIDIYVPSMKTGFEIDGGIHKAQIGYDDFRDSYLQRHGVKIYRFKNAEIGTPYFTNAVWQVFNVDYVHTRYNKILKVAKQNQINLKEAA